MVHRYQLRVVVCVGFISYSSVVSALGTACAPNCTTLQDCDSGNYCFDRNIESDGVLAESIPGCGPVVNLTESATNKYCVEAEPGQLLDYGPTPSAEQLPLGECQGSCTSNSDCDTDLICWQRSSVGVNVPGCIGGQKLPDTTTNFCVRPGSCQSECNRNSDCGPGYYCYSGVSALNDVCGNGNRKYCVEASPGLIIDYGANPDDIYKPFGACQGDCDADTDCKAGLVCQRRGSNDPVFGCFFGGSLSSASDFCTSPPPPTAPPTPEPTQPPFFLPTPPEGTITYHPGNLTTFKDDLLLSEGLDAKLLATSNQTLEYVNGTFSEKPFHTRPDGGACFPDERDGNEDGWVYVSNAEVRQTGGGGVGALTFNKDGDLIDYRMVLEGTTNNCGGGKTPWNTWMSCEENGQGKIYQVDPLGLRDAEMASIGNRGGAWESFAADVRDEDNPKFFATEDRRTGALERFTPDSGGSGWDAVNGSGRYEYLVLRPTAGNAGTGTFYWTATRSFARINAQQYYPNTEGIDFYDGRLYFVCKTTRWMFILDLDEGTYERTSTRSGLFDGKPDQIRRIVNDDEGLVYFTEEGGNGGAGVHARDADGRYYTVMESPRWRGETAGLAFSPDGTHMYIAYQNIGKDIGKLYAIWRRDGLPFQGTHLDVNYHTPPIQGQGSTPP